MNNIYVRQLFEKEEAQRILDDVISENFGTFKRSRLYEPYRGKMHFREITNERRSWEQVFHDHTQFAWIKKRVTNHVKDALLEFGLSIEHISYPQGLRFIKYDSAEQGFQTWHTDRAKDTRILTCVIQLTDPETYDGARLEFKSDVLSQQVPVEQGSLIIFPSNQLHRVTECTRGIRYSLVIWAEEKGLVLPEGFVSDAD